MKMHIILALTTVVSSVTFGQTLKDAIRKTDNERFAEANNDFRKLIASEPANGSIYFYAGENYQFQGELDSAMIMWKKAYDVQALSPLSIVSLGKSLWISGDQVGAKTQFANAMKMTKNKNAEVIRAIAGTYVYSKNKNLDEAITLLQLATNLESKNEDGFLMLGDALIEKNPTNGNEAIKSYNQVLEINSKSPRGIVRVAKVYQRAQNFELANEKYKEAQTIDPTYAPAYRENAELNMRFNQSKKAIENWKKYLELNNSDEARYRFCTALFSGKQYCDAITEIESLQAKGFDNFYMERMLTYSNFECWKDAESTKKGLAASQKFFEIAPADKVLFLDYKYKGLLLSKSGSDSLSIIELEKASSINEEAAKELAGDIGKMYLKMKKYDKVIFYYNLKASASKLSPQELFELGRSYFFGPKDYVNADSSFARLLVISPTYAPAMLWRARSNFQQDPKNANWMAQPYYEKVIEMVKVEERTVGNNKGMVIESAKYLGDYYVTSKAKDLAKAKINWQIVKDLDPADKQAKAFFGEK